MRYFVRDKIFDMLPTFVEAIDYINNELYESANLVIEDLKSGLNSIRMTFNESFTAETSNEYDRIIAQMEQQLMLIEENKIQEQPTDEETDVFKQLLKELEQKLKNEPEVKLEILFIPYKYSMWDSLESIWLAAKDDPRCNARVMPIPYYDRDENGLLGEFHYEIEEYIKNDIPVVPYKDYDYTIIRPDIIYFHNPYDGNNRVTSVAPEFYSDKLKQHTDMLVYVPYFVAGNYSKLETAKPFINNSGVMNANKVIVQSNILKKAYVQAGISPEKVEVLGSPKVDAVLKNEEKVNIPSQWNKLKDKKIILLNSSLRDFLNEDNYLNDLKINIESILKREEFGLIWRPHPLFETTIKSMKTEQINKFNEIKRIVTSSSKSIIDKNSDMYPAIYFSDALITDSSSMIQIYIMTKKPVYILYRDPEFEEKAFLSSDFFSSYFEKELEFDMYLDLIEEGKDPQGTQRYNSFRKSIVNSDGSSGKKIHHFISGKISNIL